MFDGHRFTDEHSPGGWASHFISSWRDLRLPLLVSEARSCVGLPVSFNILIQLKHGVPLERGCSFLSVVPLGCVNSSEGRKED